MSYISFRVIIQLTPLITIAIKKPVYFKNYLPHCSLIKKSLFYKQNLVISCEGVLWRITVRESCPHVNESPRISLLSEKRSSAIIPIWKHTHTSCPLHKHVYRKYIFFDKLKLSFSSWWVQFKLRRFFSPQWGIIIENVVTEMKKLKKA